MELYTYKLSALDWKPVGFDVIGNNFKLKNKPLAFSNGMTFNLYDFLSGVNDLSFNNKTGIILTGGIQKNSEIIEETEKQNILSSLKKINTNLSDVYGKIYTHYSIFNNASGLQATGNDISAIDQITLNFVDDYVVLEDVFGKVLTNGGFGESQTTFSSKSSPLTEYQKWNYILGDNVICLFGYDSPFKNILVQNQNKRLTLTPFNSIQGNLIPSESFLVMNSYFGSNPTENAKTVKDSFLVQYDSNPTLDENNLKILNIDQFEYQNFLGMFPYEFLKENGNYDFCFHGLKNYQDAEYEYSLQSINRKYYRIYSGTKQVKGSDKIALNYISDKLSVNFEANKKTDFYLSPTVESIPLSSSTFIIDGATPGQYPYSSDRLYSKRDSNLSEIPQLEKIIKKSFNKDNKFLCSWLYGSRSDENEPIWYDRYYNAAKYSQNQALAFTYMSYHEKLDPKQDFVYDIPSEIIMKPGYLYSYYHVGNEDAKTFLKDLNYTYSKSNDKIVNSNVLNVTSWGNTLIDNSGYKNDGLIFGTSAIETKNYWKLDGTNYAIFQANSSLLPETNFTVSLWLNFEDWSNIDAYQIFGNFYESGFGLINENKSTSPLFTLIENSSDTIYNFNYQLSEVSTIKTELQNADYVQRLSDFSYWVFDSKTGSAIKYNVNNSIESKDGSGIYGPISLGLSQIDQIEISSNETMYVYDNKQKKYTILSKDGSIIGSGTTPKLVNRIEVDLNDVLLNGTLLNRAVYGNCSVIDNNNSLWQIIGPNLYKDNNIIGTVGASNFITCDVYNNIWIISDDDDYSKFDNDGNLIFKNSFSKTPLLNETICPPSPPPLPPTIKVLDEDLPFLSTNDFKYILTLPDYYQILVTPPKLKRKPIIPITRRHRAIDFVSPPQLKKLNQNLTNICGLSSIEYDQMVMVDMNDNQVYLINQLGQLTLKLNLEILSKNDQQVSFKSGGDFSGYQYNRKYKNIKNSNLSWKYQLTSPNDSETNITEILNSDISNLTPGWHHICFTISLDQINKFTESCFYIDSILMNKKSYNGEAYSLNYKYRTSLILGATTIKNTLLNNFLNTTEGYKMIGSVADLKMYNYSISPHDVEQLYYGSDFSPKLKDLKWKMPIGDRNYTEEISEWFKFQMPTNKSKFFNLNIHNLNVDDNVKKNIENSILNIINKITPSHTTLNKINWKGLDKTIRRGLPNYRENVRRDEGNSMYIGFGASTSSNTSNQHWIHDFLWNSELEIYNKNSILTNSNIFGNAIINGNNFRLTNNLSNQNGNVYFNNPVTIANDFGELLDWQIYFKFSMGGGNRGEGLCLILASNNASQGLGGYGFGYSGIENSIAVAFDTVLNTGIDSNNNHIEIDVNGDVINSITKTTNPFDFCGTTATERMVHVWVEYLSFNKILNIYTSLSNTRPSSPTLTYPIDIRKYINMVKLKNKSYTGLFSVQ